MNQKAASFLSRCFSINLAISPPNLRHISNSHFLSAKIGSFLPKTAYFLIPNHNYSAFLLCKNCCAAKLFFGAHYGQNSSCFIPLQA